MKLPRNAKFPGRYRIIIDTRETGAFTAGRYKVKTEIELRNTLTDLETKFKRHKYKDVVIKVELEQ